MTVAELEHDLLHAAGVGRIDHQIDVGHRSQERVRVMEQRDIRALDQKESDSLSIQRIDDFGQIAELER